MGHLPAKLSPHIEQLLAEVRVANMRELEAADEHYVRVLTEAARQMSTSEEAADIFERAWQVIRGASGRA